MGILRPPGSNMVNCSRLGADRVSCKAFRTTTSMLVSDYPVHCSINHGLLLDFRGRSLVMCSEGPVWLAVGSAHAGNQPETSLPGSMESGLEA